MCLGTNVCGYNRVWAHSCVGANVSGHKRVWAHSCVGTIVCGHNRVWAQSCLGTIVSGHNRVWAQSCLGTVVSGHNRVWAQSCLGTIVSGHNRVWAQSCLGTIVSGHNRVGSIVWAQSCMGPIVVEPIQRFHDARRLSTFFIHIDENCTPKVQLSHTNIFGEVFLFLPIKRFFLSYAKFLKEYILKEYITVSNRAWDQKFFGLFKFAHTYSDAEDAHAPLIVYMRFYQVMQMYYEKNFCLTLMIYT